MSEELPGEIDRSPEAQTAAQFGQKLWSILQDIQFSHTMEPMIQKTVTECLKHYFEGTELQKDGPEITVNQLRSELMEVLRTQSMEKGLQSRCATEAQSIIRGYIVFAEERNRLNKLMQRKR